MTLPDGPRQITASLLAAGLFLLLYFGLGIVWWLALLLAATGYFALLLIVGRRRPDTEIMVTDSVSAADIRAADRDLRAAADRLTAAAKSAPESDQHDLRAMADHVLSIRTQIAADPNDFRKVRQFIGFFLPKIVEAVEGYVLLARRPSADPARIREVGGQIRRFLAVIERIDKACVENDLTALEIEADVLATQLDRG